MDIPDILHRLSDNTVTDAERAAFAAYLKRLSPDAYEALMQQYEAIDQDVMPDTAPDPAMLTRILDEIGVLTPLELRRGERLPPQRSLLRWMAPAIAAACVLLIAGIYLLRNPSRPVIPPPVAIATTVPPGGNKATLTLANGATIVLDSLANGRLTGEGGAEVVKLGDGKLQYRAGVQNGNGSATGILYNTLATPRGGQYHVILSDGTKVWLNAASAIRYPTAFTGRNREVEIRGEAYLEVARNENHPFKVHVLPDNNSLPTDKDQMNIEVLGTSFNINAYQDEADKQVKTTLLEGAVRVSLGAKTQLIRPGQQAGLTFSDQHFSISNDVDMESVMAWKNGKLVFRKGNIRELMQEISRWYDVDIQYQGQVPSGGYYGLIDRNVPLTSVLRVLGAYGIQARLENKTIIVQ